MLWLVEQSVGQLAIHRIEIHWIGHIWYIGHMTIFLDDILKKRAMLGGPPAQVGKSKSYDILASASAPTQLHLNRRPIF